MGQDAPFECDNNYGDCGTPEMSGGVRSYDIAKHLVNCGHSVDMVTTSRVNVDKVGWSYTNEDGINVHWFSLFYSNQLSYINSLKYNITSIIDHINNFCKLYNISELCG